MQFESCLWPRPKVIWRMFLPTNKPFRSLASVVELGELLRQRTATQMVKDVGLLNLQDLFLIYLRMLRVMQKYVLCSTDCAFPLFFLLHLSLTDAILLSCSSGERLGCRHSLHISHPGKPSSKAEASDVPCSWKNQPWVLACRYWWACIAVYHAQFVTYLFCSLHVIALPYWVDFVWEGRTCQEGGIPSKHYLLKCFHVFVGARYLYDIYKTNICLIP